MWCQDPVALFSQSFPSNIFPRTYLEELQRHEGLEPAPLAFRVVPGHDDDAGAALLKAGNDVLDDGAPGLEKVDTGHHRLYISCPARRPSECEISLTFSRCWFFISFLYFDFE